MAPLPKSPYSEHMLQSDKARTLIFCVFCRHELSFSAFKALLLLFIVSGFFSLVSIQSCYRYSLCVFSLDPECIFPLSFLVRSFCFTSEPFLLCMQYPPLTPEWSTSRILPIIRWELFALHFFCWFKGF